MSFDDDLKIALGMSEALYKIFGQFGIYKIRDLLFHLPLRYEDRSHITPIPALKDGQTVLIHGQVVSANLQRGRRQMLKAIVQDASGEQLQITYFRFYPSLLKHYQTGRMGLFYGKAQYTQFGYQMAHPEVTWLAQGEVPQLSDTLHAVYPTSKGLTQLRWQQTIRQALNRLVEEEDVLTALGFYSLKRALTTIHQPQTHEGLLLSDVHHHPAWQRLILEELIAHQLSLLSARQLLRSYPAPVLSENVPLIQQFLTQLPFALTVAQQRVAREISADMASSQAMLRLVQGDVGSGKTVIALLACLQAIASGYQAVFMAPTELLAEQHAQNIQRLLGDLPVKTVRLVSKLSAKDKRERLASIAQGEAQLIIGTHAVFQKQVRYHRLALVAIDEQHRFGVHQRLQLQEKAPQNTTVHQLILTATPIPRTLAMSAYGELDTSVIDQLPAGRKPIRTTVVSNEKRQAVIARVGAVCASGRQAYWVCPLIEESEVLECENAEQTAQTISALLPHIKVALVHGRLDADVRRQTMADFAQGRIDLLVATTVIEVGVDVPNACLMIIENAERFGLSQLHQLRGRVGRGSEQSDCLLMYQAPLGETAKRRLSIMRETTDGFRIAEVDLEIRGAGELLGTRQTGESGLRIADLERDITFAEYSEQLATQFWQENPAFVEVLARRWVGQKAQYLNV